MLIAIDLQSLAKILAVTCCGIFSGAALYVTLVEHPARMERGTQSPLPNSVPVIAVRRSCKLCWTSAALC